MLKLLLSTGPGDCKKKKKTCFETSKKKKLILFCFGTVLCLSNRPLLLDVRLLPELVLLWVASRSVHFRIVKFKVPIISKLLFLC